MNTDNKNQGNASSDDEIEKLLGEVRRQQNYVPKKEPTQEFPVKTEETVTQKPVTDKMQADNNKNDDEVPKQEDTQVEDKEDFVDIYAHLQGLNSTMQIPIIKDITVNNEEPTEESTETKEEKIDYNENIENVESTNFNINKNAEQQDITPTNEIEKHFSEGESLIAQNQNEIKKEKTKTAEQKKKKAHIAVAVIIALILVIGSFFVIMCFNPAVSPEAAPVIAQGDLVAPKESGNVFVKGIKVAGVDLGGKTVDEAAALLAVKDDEVVSKFEVTVKNTDKTLTYNQDDFIYTYNAEKTVNQAFEYSKQVEGALANGKDRNVAIPEGIIATTDKETGAVNFSIPCKVTESSVAKVVKKICNEWDIPMHEPRIAKVDTSKKDGEMCTFEDGIVGTIIDSDKLHSDFMNLFTNGGISGTLTVETVKKSPTMKINDVKNSVVKLAEYSTQSSNTWNATQNMAHALNLFNGNIIRAGETWSFNKQTGNSNEEDNGFLPAGVISGGKMELGVGGGICQAASTLYNAAIRANMEIVERQPHLWCSYYVYGGLDATIDWGNIDVKIKNTTKYDMFLKTWMSDDGYTLHTEIYGWQDPKFDEVRTESWISWNTGDHYGTDAQRVFYLKGKEVGREDLPSSEYSTSEGHAVIGGDPGKESTKIEHKKPVAETTSGSQSAT